MEIILSFRFEVECEIYYKMVSHIRAGVQIKTN